MPRPGEDLIILTLEVVDRAEPRSVSEIARRVSMKRRRKVSVDTVGVCLRILRKQGKIKKTTKIHCPLGGYVRARAKSGPAKERTRRRA